MNIDGALQGKDNNLNLIRMIAASAVLFSHSYALVSGLRDLEPLKQVIGLAAGHIAVDIFFVVSGFLVTRSLVFRKDLVEFCVSRFLRIYPALWVAVFLCVLMGLAVTELSVASYLADSATLQFLFYNSTIILTDYQELGGVFANQPFDNSVNGSLWTLPWELRMYAVLFFLGIAGLVLRLRGKGFEIFVKGAVVIIAFIAMCGHFYLKFITGEDSGFYWKLSRFLFLFFYGGAFFVFARFIPLKGWLFVCGVLLLIAFVKTQFYVFYTLVLPYLIFYLAFYKSEFALRYNKLGDYSYGMYIYAWPVQQLLVYLWPDVGIYQHMMFSFFVSLVFAYFSWILVESPSIALKKSVFRRLERMKLQRS
ncbi:acyltransferase family protein [Alteromonas sp. CYL-A6]|uniref:acyltransferase family protein n=1 Tax=Alteromonas nitratireducens TaxID=3390813 RepID=UPI0034AB7281